MEKLQPDPESKEVKDIIAEAVRLGDELNIELNRILEQKGRTVWEKYFNETFSPMGMSRQELSRYAVYHALIRSTPPWFNGIQVDLLGKNNLLSFAKTKLEELKKV